MKDSNLCAENTRALDWNANSDLAPSKLVVVNSSKLQFTNLKTRHFRAGT